MHHPTYPLPAAPESELISRCCAGDREAWDQLVTRHLESLFRFAYSLSRNYEEAGDITAQTLVRLYESLHTFRGESSFTTWLFHIARNLYLDQCVKSRHAQRVMLEDTPSLDIPDERPGPEAELMRKELRRTLATAIARLPGYQREVMEQAHRGRRYEEIAAECGLPLGTVKSRMNRARRSLRERLDLD